VGIENPYGEPIIGFFLPVVQNINLSGFSPRQASLGLALKVPLPVHLTLAYDLTWKQYSLYQTNREVSPVPLFHDTFTSRIGADLAFNPGFSVSFLDKMSVVSLRLGYYFEPTPVEVPSTADVQNNIPSDNIFDSDLDVFSIGLCIIFETTNFGHVLQGVYQYQHLRHQQRMAFIDSVYAHFNNISILDRYIPVEIGGNVWSIGCTYTLQF